MSDFNLNQNNKSKISKSNLQILKLTNDIFIISDEFNIIKISSITKKLLEFSSGELDGISLTNLITEKSKDRLSKIFHKILSNGKQFRAREFTFITKYNNFIYADLHILKIKHNQKNVFLITGNDITEHKKNEKNVKQNVNLFKTIINNINGYVYNTKYKDGYVVSTYHNSKCIKITGYKPEEYENDPLLWIKMVYEEDKNFVYDFFMNLSPNKKNGSVEHRIVHKNGKIRWIANNFTLTFNSKSELTRMDGLILDITDKKNAEKALSDKNLFFQNIIDAIPNPIFYKNSKGIYLGCNKAFEKLANINRSSLIGKNINLISSTNYSTKSNTIDYELFTSGGEKSLTTRIALKDGGMRDVIINKATYHNSEGEIAGVVGVVIDVTEIKTIQYELQNAVKNLSALEQIVNKSSSVVFLLNLHNDYEVEFISENIKQFGYSSSDFINKKLKFTDFVYHEDVEILINQVNYFKTLSPEELEFEFRICDSNNDIKWINSKVWLLSNENGEVTHVQGIIVDITEKKYIEQNLIDKEERYRSVVDNSYDLICEIDVNSNFVFVSPNFKQVLGYDKEDLLGKSIIKFVHYNDILILNSELKNNFGKANLRFKKKNSDEYVIFECTGNKFETTNGKIFGVITMRDITERIKFEKQLIQTEKLLAVGEMSAMIAHEFRNALTSVKIILQIHSENDKLKENEKKSLQTAINSVYNMEKIVNQLLTFSHPEPFEFNYTKLIEIFEDFLPFVKMECRKKNINLIINFEDHLPQIYINPQGIKDALVNLLINATQAFRETEKQLHRKIKFFAKIIELNEDLKDISVDIFKSETMTESTNKKEILISKGTKCILIEICDNGSGIEETVINKIFDPFFTTKEKGSGLGLAIVKRTICGHNGIIKVESKLNIGTTFKIYLPVN